jgi:hypothetical protein
MDVTEVSVPAVLVDWARKVVAGCERAEAALAAPCLAGLAVEPVSPGAERAEPACVEESPEPGLSAKATAPLNAAAPTPRATANPPTRPMKPAALTTAPFVTDHVS